MCCAGIVYPIQLNRVERMRFEGNLQGLENRHFHRCLSLHGGAVMQQLWPPAEFSMLSLYGFGLAVAIIQVLKYVINCSNSCQ